MSIDRTSPLQPLNPVQTRDAADTQAPKVRQDKAAVPNSTSVTLSESQTRLMQPQESDINTDRVEALKAAIRSGELKMDTGKIADALIADTRSWLQGE
ncbi:flagellar biosynthesis anti-sigma factor FlgM [Pluralibacter gergoviae]|uniref:flagellar biosynthesis anti-sigma factor FlgM n=1 Tax=Pluralibacter gergoviae TaxID=61647 RepID=UPI000651421A|nr:flagellar biosynthesis anti-sigma factor FlgM [Pluralibacter gergoviae]KMK19135.1 hypothetical protein ABW09_07040 [Pluralibacter gergoviae]KOR05946.1 hypothetical protein ABW48_00220 [Pluralibacter gergoviae]